MKTIIRYAIASLLVSTACLAQTPKVEYSFTATKVGAATPATMFAVNDEIDVAIYVRDLRPAGTWQGTKLVNGVPVTGTWQLTRGVFAAYADIAYDSTVLMLESTTFNAAYPNGIKLSANGGILDDTGAFAQSMMGMGMSKRELMRWRFKCAWGDTTFDCYFSNLAHPQCDTLVYGNDAATPPEPSLVNASEIRTVPLTISVR